jgi:hypothetical protein
MRRHLSGFRKTDREGEKIPEQSRSGNAQQKAIAICQG